MASSERVLIRPLGVERADRRREWGSSVDGAHELVSQLPVPLSKSSKKGSATDPEWLVTERSSMYQPSSTGLPPVTTVKRMRRLASFFHCERSTACCAHAVREPVAE